jgi:uncharacterized membrane protein YdjX (TVP38/TMEM64 family)
MRSGWQRYVLCLWLFLLLALWVGAAQQGTSPVALLRAALTSLQGDPLAPLLLLLLYLLRPLLLLPVTLLTVASGLFFGALWGVVYAGVAALLSATVAYLLGRTFARRVPDDAAPGLVGRLKAYPFETVLLSRFLFVPGDLVNYAVGYLRVPLGAFVLATAIGGLPGLLIGVLAGASLESGLHGRVQLNLSYLLVSAVLLVLSLGGSWWLRRRSAPTARP